MKTLECKTKVFHFHNYYYLNIYLIINIYELNIGFDDDFYIECCFAFKTRNKEVSTKISRLIIKKDILLFIAKEQGMEVEEYLFNESLSHANNIFREELMFDKFGKDKEYAYISSENTEFKEIKLFYLYALIYNEFDKAIKEIASKSRSSEFRRFYNKFKVYEGFEIDKNI